MRSVHKEDEKKLYRILDERFKSNNPEGYSLIEDQTDKPDMGIVFKGKKIGIEFTNFESQKFMEFDKTIPLPVDGQNSGRHSIKYLMDPVEKMKDILKKKSHKYHLYKQRGNFFAVWLAIHSESHSLSQMGEDAKWYIEHVWATCVRKKCPYERVIFVGLTQNEVFTLYEKGKPIPVSGKVQIAPSYFMDEVCIINCEKTEPGSTIYLNEIPVVSKFDNVTDKPFVPIPPIIGMSIPDQQGT